MARSKSNADAIPERYRRTPEEVAELRRYLESRSSQWIDECIADLYDGIKFSREEIASHRRDIVKFKKLLKVALAREKQANKKPKRD